MSIVHQPHHAGHGLDSTHRRNAVGGTLGLALVLTLGFSVVEFVAGWLAGSLALLADAGHMVSDGAALGLSALAAWLASLPPSRRHTYGLGKAELLAALVNALAMLAVVALIGLEAWRRLQMPAQIDGATQPSAWWPFSVWRSICWLPGYCRAGSRTT